MTDGKGPGCLRLWAIGRHPLVAIAVLVAATLVAVRWWYVTVAARVFGQFAPRWIQTLEIVPVASGILGLAALAPRSPRLDGIAGRTRRAVSAGAALTALSLSAALPLFVPYLLALLPPSWVAEYNGHVPPGQRFIDVIDLDALAPIVATVAGLVGLAAALIALLGAVWGVGSAALCYAGLILVQSTQVGARLAEAPVAVWGVLAACLAVGGTVVWYRTGAGAPVRARAA